MSSIDQLTPEKRKTFYRVMCFTFGTLFTLIGTWGLVKSDIFRSPELILEFPRAMGLVIGIELCGVGLLIWGLVLLFRR